MSLTFAVLAAVLILGGNAFAQIGMLLEKGAELPNRTSVKKVNEFGEEFVRITTEDDKGLVLEMDFLEGKCVYARWILRQGKLPADFKEELWKQNFEGEKIVKKDKERWKGNKGNGLSWGWTKSGKEVVVVTSKRMMDVFRAEAVRSVEEKYEKDDISQGSQKKDGGFRITFGGRDNDRKLRQVYDEKGNWVGSIRNGQLYGTDASWKGSVLNEQIFDADSNWKGSINNNGSVSSPDGGWIGTAR